MFAKYRTYIRSILLFTIVSLLVAAGHHLLVESNGGSAMWLYSVVEIYLFLIIFSLCSLVIISIVHNRTKDQAGFAFLITSSLKLVTSAGLLFSLFKDSAVFHSWEKSGYIIAFLLILSIETVFVSRFLNK